MTIRLPTPIRAVVLGLAVVSPMLGSTPASASSAASASTSSAMMDDVYAYLKSQRTTGFMVIMDGHVLAQQYWPAPADPLFANFVYGAASDGSLLEDVASQQKSFVSVLAAVAIDKGLLNVDKPVSAYLGQGWSKAPAEAENAIRVIDVMTMSSGLDEQFRYQYPAGQTFFYNTQVYATMKRILAAASKLSLDAMTQDWLTGPAGMHDTAWRKRPAAFADVGNPTGLVTTPRDIATFGEMILHGGVAADGTRIVSPASLHAMFERSSTNHAYGRLWWLNGSAYTIKAMSKRAEGPLIPAAPADLVGALGALDRRLYVVPSLKLVVVRTGDAALDTDFDQQFWLRLMKALPGGGRGQ